MKVSLRGGDINEVYSEVAKKYNVDKKVISSYITKFFNKCFEDIKNLEPEGEYRIYKIGVLKRVKRKK